MRLIDADALLEAMKKEDVLKVYECIQLVTNAPTIQREGWDIERLEEMRQQYVMNPELHATKQAYINALEYELKAMIAAAPTDTE